MGSGKTAVGRILSKRLNMSFVDTDKEIEKKLGLSVDKIFKKKGEEFFRNEERNVLQQLRHGIPQVVGAGGGMVLSLLNREIFRQGIWINLNASLAVIMSRIGNQSHRPLLGNKVDREELDRLFKHRRPYYDLAPYQVITDGLNAGAVVELIVRLLQRRDEEPLL